MGDFINVVLPWLTLGMVLMLSISNNNSKKKNKNNKK